MRRDRGMGIGHRAFSLVFATLLGAGGLAQSPSADPRAPGFVEIPAGPFTMGADRASDPLAFDNEKWSPSAGEGTVDLPAFFIASHEVTVAEFARFAQAG